jgi:hypothetical protein
MNLYKVAFFYICEIIGLIIFIHTVYELVTGKYAKKIGNPVTEEQKRKSKKYQFGFYLFAAILLGFVNGLYGILALLDLPYVLRNEYPYTVGTVTEVDDGSQGDVSIIIEDDVSKEEIEIVLIYKEIREGERVKAYYLPHMKIGTVYRVWDED